MVQSGGVGLGGLVIVVGALYFTGAGGWMLDRLQPLGSECNQALSIAGPSVSGPVCGGVDKAIGAATKASTAVGDQIRKVTGFFGGSSSSASSSHFESISEMRLALEQRLASLSSSADDLERMIKNGPQKLTSGNVNQQFQRAVDSFTIGQHYASKGNTAQAVPWLQQGAMQPQGFGLMSQLSLGDMYRTGGNGVAANPMQAQAYYGMASNSIGELSRSNSLQAQQLLQSLPASPQQVQRDIAQAMNALQRGVR